jgi:hypothetical protein
LESASEYLAFRLLVSWLPPEILRNITATAGLLDDSRMLQISAAVQPGNSGGPLMDQSSNIVDIVVAKLNALKLAAATKDVPQNVNFAIESAVEIKFLEANSVPTPMLPTKSFRLPMSLTEQKHSLCLFCAITNPG